MTQSVVVQGKLRRREDPGGAEPRALPAAQCPFSFLPLPDRSGPVRKPGRLLLLGLGAEGARRGQPGTGPRPEGPLTCPQAPPTEEQGVPPSLIWPMYVVRDLASQYLRF